MFRLPENRQRRNQISHHVSSVQNSLQCRAVCFFGTELVRDRSVLLEEYARKLIAEEEQLLAR